MNTRFILPLVILAISLSQASCHSPKQRALRALNAMKAGDYFQDPIQARFAEAVAKGDKETMRDFLRKGADVNAVGRAGMRPLMWALAKRSLKGFKFLLEHDADPNFYMKDVDNLPQHDKPSLMETLAASNYEEYLKLALEHGGNPDFMVESYYPDGRLSYRDPIIFTAIIHNRLENVRMLADAGANIEYQDTQFLGAPPIMDAAAINDFDIVYYLLEKGADPALKERTGWNLMTMIEKFRDRGIKKDSDEYQWYMKVVDELKRRGLLRKDLSYQVE